MAMALLCVACSVSGVHLCSGCEFWGHAVFSGNVVQSELRVYRGRPLTWSNHAVDPTHIGLTHLEHYRCIDLHCSRINGEYEGAVLTCLTLQCSPCRLWLQLA
jgi:hypothetical protein